jgi:hypothetical protein
VACDICQALQPGLMAPGMSEVITIEFCPTEVRYFYDCVRIHNEDENLLVPIHAYPVMNEVARGLLGTSTRATFNRRSAWTRLQGHSP